MSVLYQKQPRTDTASSAFSLHPKRAEMAKRSLAAEFLVLAGRVAEEYPDIVRGLGRELA